MVLCWNDSLIVVCMIASVLLSKFAVAYKRTHTMSVASKSGVAYLIE